MLKKIKLLYICNYFLIKAAHFAHVKENFLNFLKVFL